MWAWPVQKGGAEVDEAWLKLKATLIANPQRPHSEWVSGWFGNGKLEMASGKRQMGGKTKAEPCQPALAFLGASLTRFAPSWPRRIAAILK